MKGFWKVLGLAALVGSIPFQAEKDENGALKNMKALLWQYNREPVTDDESEVNHVLSLGPNLQDLKEVGEKVTGAIKNAKESFLADVDIDLEDVDDDVCDCACEDACGDVTEADFADGETQGE